jgi:hypothetical protein
VLDFGPLFNPGAYYAASAEPKPVDPHPEPEPAVITTHAERRDALRRTLRALVAQASTAFAVDHRLVHATLNQRFGGPVATATLAGLEGRRRLIETWLERRTYDGLR